MTYTPTSNTPSNHVLSPSPAIALTTNAAPVMANRSSGLPNTSVIGLPIAHEINTSSGASTSATWIAEPMQMLSTSPILSCRANQDAANRSAAVPTSASTTTPRKTSDKPSALAADSSAPDTSSASSAIATVAPTRTSSATQSGHPASPPSSRSSEANTSRCVTSV